MPAISESRSTQTLRPYCTNSHPQHKGCFGRNSNSRSRSRTQLFDSLEPDCFASSEPWILSPNDLDRLSNLRNRQKTLPLLIGQDSLLPGQKLELTSPDAKFQRMCQTLHVNDELALVGMHPYRPGEPLTVGVTVIVEQKTIVKVVSSSPSSAVSSLDPSSSSSTPQILLKVKAKEIVDVQGQPWWDEKRSCFITNLEVAQDDFDDGTIMSASKMSSSTPLTNAANILSMKKSRHYQQAKLWFDELPALLEQWWNAMDHGTIGFSNNLSPQVIATIAKEMDFTNRALAIAALLNPSSPPSLTHQQYQQRQHSSKPQVTKNSSSNPAVCLEIRPALLACRNYYDRVHLVHAALQALLRQEFTGGGDDYKPSR